MTLTAVRHSFQSVSFSLYGPTEINVITCSDVPELTACLTVHIYYMHCRQVGTEHFYAHTVKLLLSKVG